MEQPASVAAAVAVAEVEGRQTIVLQNRSGHLRLGAPSAGQAKAANSVAGARSSCPSQTLP